ncbi:hypothetical protein KY289_019629 [Solanum tuberosum]|nr:hypothetical protein KY289_019629 [Solanum tuberosum]
MMCEANKGIYIKAGQFVAAINQVPKEYSTTLSSLQDHAIPFQFESIKHVLVSNLGLNCLSEFFFSFDEVPVAAASIAQVHHAVLVKDRQEVAVKVQYLGLEYQMKFDLVTMSLLSKSVGWIFPGYRFQWLVTEFEKSIASELDFIAEAKNLVLERRTIDSKSALGEGMSVEERKNLKQDLKSPKMEDISSFMESLPTDFLTVLRIDGLLRSLTSKLGAPLRVWLLAYAEYALYGLSLKADSKCDSAIGVVLFRFKIGLRYIQLRLLFGILGLVSWLENIKHTSTRRFTDFLASAGFVVRSLYRPLLTA